MTLTVASENDGSPITILTDTVDQAGLQGLLRWLYSLGLPLISAICVVNDSEEYDIQERMEAKLDA